MRTAGPASYEIVGSVDFVRAAAVMFCNTRHDRGSEGVDAGHSQPPVTMTDGQKKRHRKQLLIFTLSAQVLIQLLIFLCSYLPLFDSSPWVVWDKLNTWWATASLLRWDVFHIGLVAEERVYEHQWAFFPGVPGFIKLLGHVTPNDRLATLLQGGLMLAIACDSTLVLYELSLRHLKSPSLSFLSAMLSLLPSSPATLRYAAYAEPFFTWASYRGCIRS
jgi:phosphatidylinositol glycan class V